MNSITCDSTTVRHGFLPRLSGFFSDFLSGDGTFIIVNESWLTLTDKMFLNGNGVWTVFNETFIVT